MFLQIVLWIIQTGQAVVIKQLITQQSLLTLLQTLPTKRQATGLVVQIQLIPQRILLLRIQPI